MPLYEFECLSKKCECNKFEILLSIKEFEDVCNSKNKVRCPQCKSKKVKKAISLSSFAFTDPRGTSKMDNFEYRAGFHMERAKAERRAAEEASHMGTNPYLDAEGFDLGEKDIENFEGKIV